MTARARPRERSRNPDDISVIILELLREIDLVARGVFVEDLEVGDFVADLDEGARGGMEGSREGGTDERG